MTGRADVRADVRFAVALCGALALLFGFGAGPALAAPAPPRVSLLTMGPGDPFVTLFGHDALLVEREGIRPLVYNFGMYTPESITIPRILAGHLRYFLLVEPYERTFSQYRREGRSLSIQRLALPADAAEALARALSTNSLPENIAYRYDYAFDNCTTRVRDALDRALGGALRRTLEGDSGRTYRDHALRLTADHWLYFLAFDLGLGPSADRPLRGWDDAYLPDRLAEAVRRVRLPGGAPLVAKEERAYGGRYQARARAPNRLPWFLAAGVTLGGLLVFLGRKPGTLGRRLFGVAASLVGLVSGVTGLWLLALLLTKVHPVTQGNVNILLSPPWALGLVGVGVAAGFGHARSLFLLSRGALVCLVGALAGVLVMPLVEQDGWRIALFQLPLWAGLWAGARSRAGS